MRIEFDPDNDREVEIVKRVIGVDQLTSMTNIRQRSLDQLRARLNEFNFRAIETAMTLEDGWTLDDLADTLGCHRGYLTSAWRNIGRSLKHAELSPFVAKTVRTKDNRLRNTYYLKPEFRVPQG
jgi:ribosome-interacting GTPase 1